MNKINDIEKHIGFRFPPEYKQFLFKAHSFIIENNVYCRILQDDYRTNGVVDNFYTVENFIEGQEYRDYLIEMQTHFENLKEYVEAEYLYHIASGLSGCVCIALGGQHYGKIYSVDNGDFGIIYQASNINEFIESVYEPSKFRCTFEEIIEAVKANNLTSLSELIEKKDGNKQIEYSSWLDIELFKIAYDSRFDNILQYLISKGYKGHNFVDYYKLKY